MADENWKKRLGITINYSSGDDDYHDEVDNVKESEENDSVEYRRKNMPIDNVLLDQDGNSDRQSDEIISRYDMFGSTPPRTRIKMKNRDWDRKQKLEAMNGKSRSTGGAGGNNDSVGGIDGTIGGSGAVSGGVGQSRLVRSRANRRNTMDCAILNEMFIDDDTTRKEDKRSKQLLREYERDQKRSSMILNGVVGVGIGVGGTGPGSSGSIPIVQSATNNTMITTTDKIRLNSQSIYEDRIDSVPNNRCRVLKVIPKLIETCNKYMSVTSRPIGCRQSAPASAFALNKDKKFDVADVSKIQTRQAFHETFANLIKLGSSTDKPDIKPSPEEETFQTELKDLIWLELQAWHADRTLDQQDKYLYSARQEIPGLLEKILLYKFEMKYAREISIDSGISNDSSIKSNNENCNPNCKTNLNNTKCPECFSMYCKDCQEKQSIALREVEELLTRLESAESLYPSTQVMATCHPIYRCEQFVGKVKAMCLWYNITRHQRLKLIILGKILARLQGKEFKWPMNSDPMTVDSSSSSVQENDDSGRDSVDSRQLPPIRPTIPKVTFSMDGDSSNSPNDSISSVESTKENSSETCNPSETVGPSAGEYGKFVNEINLYNVEPLTNFTYENANSSTSPYRKYIENVLKSRGLGRSLSFLHRLHNVVLRKAQITLEKPGMEDIEMDMDGFDEDIPDMETPLDKEQEEELRRFGAWSNEAIALQLPSYVPAFLFLSVIPLEVIHEFLRMRIETKPLTPNPLSLEQLMKELREGLTLAITHRERFHKHIFTALFNKETELEKYTNILDKFDATVKQVLGLYLVYVEQWILVAAPSNHRKSALDKEWLFTKLICPMIPGQHSTAAKKFCSIVCSLLENIGNRLITRAKELDQQISITSESDGDAKKWQILTICRETQSLFTIERENSLKILCFAKSLCRDIGSCDFHREHHLDCDETHNSNNMIGVGIHNTHNSIGAIPMHTVDHVCQEVKDAVQLLQNEVLLVRTKLTEIIEQVQERCDIKHIVDMDEADKIAVQSRSREILHQGYKFGFEYHKDVVRLFETKIVTCKDKECECNLSLGIINFAKMWMAFVTQRCERGRGVRPRWAAQGLEFLMLACDPVHTRQLNEIEFEDLKSKMDACISHVVGYLSEPEKIRKRPSPRSRKLSPAATRARTPTRNALTVTQRQISTISNSSNSSSTSGNITPDKPQQYLQQYSVLEESVGMSPISTPTTPEMIKKQTSVDMYSTGNSNNHTLTVPRINPFGPALRPIRVRDAVNRLDMAIDNKLKDRNLIGQVKTLNYCEKIHMRARSVHFQWHRGIKIGQGRFGKVYTAVNNSTGELMAMKEITIQPGETRAIKKVAEELKIFEGISHQYLVKYYGVEIHREELLIFMELCSEGTLESLVELSGGLFEGLTRRFTYQLLSAVEELHKHGVVHRDIKTANIFLTNGGNCLKLGDFGSAVKIQANTTMPGELQGYVGTQAYMAPEVFTKTNSTGHGRASDIWSVGCVVIEMSSGKRPWAQFDSNFQIMFKVGMGETPEAPDSLSQEGHDFLDKCLQHDPKVRSTAPELLQHHFCKVGVENDNLNDTMISEIRRSFRKMNSRKHSAY